MKKARAGDCHGNAAINAFNADSTVAVTVLDGNNNVTPWQGIIPVPGNFQDVFSFDFVHYDPGTDTWSFRRKLRREAHALALLWQALVAPAANT